MSRYVVEIAPLAERDLRDAILWYRERSALAAEAFRAEAFDVIDRIGDTPLGKTADVEGNRRRVLHRFPYSVVYEVLGNTVTVLAVTHHRRKPGYWRTSAGGWPRMELPVVAPPLNPTRGPGYNACSVFATKVRSAWS